jgi:hypothetical protein
MKEVTIKRPRLPIVLLAKKLEVIAAIFGSDLGFKFYWLQSLKSML